MELGLQVASLGADGGPGTLRQGCLEPRGTFAQAGGAALAGAFVVARAATGPGEQMAGGGEAAHVEPDFREDDLPAQVTDAGDRAQLADGVAERAEVALTSASISVVAASRASICRRCGRSRKR